MRKYVFKVCLIVGIPLIGAILVNYLYMQTNFYKCLNATQKFYEVPDKIDIASFGNSHAQQGFDWSSYSDFSGMNMALGSQTLMYDNAIFDYYYDYFENGSTIVIELSYRTLYEQELSAQEGGSKITRYYQFLDQEHIYNSDTYMYYKYKYCPFFFSNTGTKVSGLKAIVDDIPYTMDTYPDKVTDLSEKERIELGETRSNVFHKQIGEQKLGLQFDALKSIIDKCKKKDMNVILITMPTLPYFYNRFSDEFFQQFYQDVDNIVALYDKCYYIDYTGDSRFMNQYELYEDSDHLNSDGAKYFTDQFVNDIKKLGVWN